jgi:MurNAc alpha-1-phosphate uridylyltransferase
MTPPVCILAGGLGTRLGELVKDTPKPLVPVTDVVLCVGYLGEKVVERVGTTAFGLRVRYSFDEPGLSGTLGAIRRCREMLGPRFLVMYGDTYLRLDLASFVVGWERSGLAGAMSVLRNADRWGKSNAVFADGTVTAYDKRTPIAAMEWIDYGLGGLTQEAIDWVAPAEAELSVLYSELAGRGQLFGFEVQERFYEIGTPVALAETAEFLSSISP